MEPLTTSIFPWYSVVQDTGPLVAALISASPCKRLIAVNEWLSMEDISELLAQGLQKDIEFTGNPPDLNQGIPEFQRGRQEMIGFSIEFGYDGGKVDKSVVKPEDLGVQVKLKSVKEWIKDQNWEAILSTE